LKIRNIIFNKAHHFLKKQKGFTIVELLCAMGIFSIMALALYVVFDRANQVWEQGQFKSEQYQNARAALDMMSREISSAIIAVGGPNSFTTSLYRPPYLVATNGTTTISGTSYDRDDIRFVFPRMDALYQAGYFISDNSTAGTVSDDTLSRRFSSSSSTNFDLATFGTPDKVAFRITDLNFSFIFKSGGSYQTATVWDSRMGYTGVSTTGATTDDGKLPEYIEITMKIADQQALQKYNGNVPDSERKIYKIMVPMNTRSFRND
jgi:prepilin-type N-terminal cleavage/methylation domain-containing protein